MNRSLLSSLALFPLVALAACASDSGAPTERTGTSTQALGEDLGDGWFTVDLGAAAIVGGSASWDATEQTMTISGAGNGGDFWFTGDSGTVAYRNVAGNFTLTAELLSYDGEGLGPYAKAVLLFKAFEEGADEPSSEGPAVYLSLNRDAEDYWYQRNTPGEAIADFTTDFVNTTDGGARVRLTRVGDVFTTEVYESLVGGGTWRPIGAPRTLVASAADGYVGMGASSLTATPMTVVFDDVEVNGAGSPPDVMTPVIMGQDLVVLDESASVVVTTNEPVSVVLEYGLDATYGSTVEDPAFYTTHRLEVTGLAPLTEYHARLVLTDIFGNVTTTPDVVYTTLDNDVDPPVVSDIVATPGPGINEVTVSFVTDEPTTSLVEYDLDRYRKAVQDFELVTEHEYLLRYVLSGETSRWGITVADPLGNETQVEDLFFDSLDYDRQALPGFWDAVDIGVVNTELAGSTEYDPAVNGGTFTSRGTGMEIYFTEDSFHFAHHPVTGDFDLRLRVDGWAGFLAPFSKGFVMFRGALDPGATMFTQTLNFAGADYLFYRPVADEPQVDITSQELQAAAGDPVWARLVRVGDVFTQYTSADGETWTAIGPPEGTTVALPASGYVGFGVSSDNNGFATEVIYSQVELHYCGDGNPDPTEACDDGNGVEGDGCANDCTVEDGFVCDWTAETGTVCAAPGCGNGIVEDGEACDDGADNSDTEADACRTDCSAASCGDGAIDTGEVCDDGVDNSDDTADACRTDCSAPSCGDGVADTGEACDDGADNSDVVADACRVDCSAPSCGDGVVDADEACDDGNLLDDDGCSALCEIEAPADGDGDGVDDIVDNCPTVGNPLQEDLDIDGAGDACDDDDDNDGIDDDIEDADGNGEVDDDETDPRSPDTDGDGLCDGYVDGELAWVDAVLCRDGEDVNGNGEVDTDETDPRLADTDADCADDGDELAAEPPTDPLDPDDRPDLPDADEDDVPDACDLCPSEGGTVDVDGCPIGGDAGGDTGIDAGTDAGDVGTDGGDDVGIDTSDDVGIDTAPDTGDDTALPDTGDDTAAPDTGDDTAAPDTGDDTAAPDTAGPDTGSDAGAGNDAGEDTDGEDSGGGKKGGCSAASGPGPFSPLALLALVALRRRRRSAEQAA